MTVTTLFAKGNHRNVAIAGLGEDSAIPTVQHLIISGKEALILDPGGHRIFPKVLASASGAVEDAVLTQLFLSHQDPDVLAALNGWLLSTNVTAWISDLWVRFVPHYGLDRLVLNRLRGIPDEGMELPFGEGSLFFVPAHFLHSCGNFHIYDPVSRTYYSGDLGASAIDSAEDPRPLTERLAEMRPFHERYMGSSVMLRAWVRMVRNLPIDRFAPQHGAVIEGSAQVAQFLDWCDQLSCGTDVWASRLALPRGCPGAT